MNRILVLFFLLSFYTNSYSQENERRLNTVIKWAPTGLILGSLSFQGEYNKGVNSYTFKVGFPLKSHHRLSIDDKDFDFDMKSLSFQAGYRFYLSKKPMKGLYLEPFLKYVHHESEGDGTGILDNEIVEFDFTNNYNGFGAGLQLGAQFLLGERFVIDLFFLGPEINASTNLLEAMETSNTIDWNSIETADAETYIRDFIARFPFIKDNTVITVDNQNKSAKAYFKGLLPGIRTGVSFGIRF